MKKTPLKRKTPLKAKTSLKAKTKLVAKTTLKKVSKKQAKMERNRFSIITNDLDHCIECGVSKKNDFIAKHEVFFGSCRQLSIKYGLIVPLCASRCHSSIKGVSIHHNQQMCLKWQKKAQIRWMEYYEKNEDEFIKIFGRNYL